MEGELTKIWQKYQIGLDYLHKIDLAGKTDRAHRFYIGDQWHGVKSGGEELPSANFIKPIIRFKVSTICQKSMTAIYMPIETDSQVDITSTIALNKYFSKLWEFGKMDTVSKKIIKDAAIGGDSYLYFGEGDDVVKAQIIDNVNIFLGDEKDDRIQEQPYIIIRERRFVKDIRKDARENGVSESDVLLIVSDEDTQDQLGDRTDIVYGGEEGKCISLLYLYKDKEGYVHASKSTKSVVYQPDTPIYTTDTDEDGNEVKSGLRSYPIVNFTWEDRKNSARGVSEVEYLIPNQLEVNKTLARRALTVKNVSYPKLAYNENAIQNPQDLDKVGANIALADVGGQGINNIVGYLNATSVAPDAKNLSDELMNNTRELAGAGDAATGSIDPTQASGTAIIAVRDQSALPLNEQITRYKQFVEDIALLWFDILKAYNPNGLEVTDAEGNTYFVTPEALEQLRFNIRIEVCDKDPYSRFAEEQSLSNLFGMKAISFEEYVSLLSEDSVLPKDKLTKIIAQRQQIQAQQAQMQQEQQTQMGGMPSEMQAMQY